MPADDCPNARAVVHLFQQMSNKSQGAVARGPLASPTTPWRRGRGQSLVELMVAVAIVAVGVALVVAVVAKVYRAVDSLRSVPPAPAATSPAA